MISSYIKYVNYWMKIILAAYTTETWIIVIHTTISYLGGKERSKKKKKRWCASCGKTQANQCTVGCETNRLQDHVERGKQYERVGIINKNVM